MDNVVELFTAQAAERPDTPAIIEGQGRRRRITTFADLDRQGAAGAGRLVSSGIRPGDRVLILVPVSARLYAVLAAVFRAGAVAVLVDPGAGRARLAESVERVNPAAFVGVPKAHLLRLLARSVRQIPQSFVTDGWLPGAQRWEGGPPAPAVPVGREAAALLTFTSGTTGRPKAAIRTHGLLAAQHAALSRALDLRPGDIDLCTLPVVVLANLASGITTVLPDADLRKPGAVDPERLGRQINQEQPNRCVASPAFFERLLTARGSLDTFRRVDTGGAPVHPDLLARLAEHVPEAVGVYGSTEAEPIAHLDHADLPAADRQRVAGGEGLPVGTPVSEVALRVVPDAFGRPLGPFTDDAWDAHALPAGASGELVVAGDHVVPGYLDGEGDEETKVRVGDRVWHRTGDAARLDADGRLWLLGRAGQGFHTASGVRYPLQVEAALRHRFGVRAALAGVHADGASVDALRLAVEGPLSPAVLEAARDLGITRVVSVEALPMDRRHNAKIDRAALETLLDARA